MLTLLVRGGPAQRGREPHVAVGTSWHLLVGELTSEVGHVVRPVPLAIPGQPRGRLLLEFLAVRSGHRAHGLGHLLVDAGLPQDALGDAVLEVPGDILHQRLP